jgi:hypothetical protein
MIQPDGYYFNMQIVSFTATHEMCASERVCEKCHEKHLREIMIFPLSAAHLPWC